MTDFLLPICLARTSLPRFRSDLIVDRYRNVNARSAGEGSICKHTLGSYERSHKFSLSSVRGVEHGTKALMLITEGEASGLMLITRVVAFDPLLFLAIRASLRSTARHSLTSSSLISFEYPESAWLSLPYSVLSTFVTLN